MTIPVLWDIVESAREVENEHYWRLGQIITVAFSDPKKLERVTPKPEPPSTRRDPDSDDDEGEFEGDLAWMPEVGPPE